MKKSSISRRNFMRSSFAGLAGMVWRPAKSSIYLDDQEPGPLVYRTLGNTGMKVPVIGMGILSSGSPALIKAALDAGITHFDSTAAPQQQARNEEMLGEVMKDRSRDSFIYGTKIHLPQDYQTGLYKMAATEEEFTRKFDAALRSLQMDYVDIVYHHMVSRKESAFHEPVMNAMEKARKAGKARFLGLTTHSNVTEAIHAAVDSDFYEVVMTTYNPRQNNLEQVKEAIARAAVAGIGIVAMKVIRGNIERGQKPVNPRASLKWVLQDPNVHATIPGFSNIDEMKMDLSIMEDMRLTDSEINDIKTEASGESMFCQGCNQCLKDCPAGLPIPDLMRAYMYTYGYKQPSLAHNLASYMQLPRRVCDDCASCQVNCQNGWDISGKIQDIIRIRDIPSDFIYA